MKIEFEHGAPSSSGRALDAPRVVADHRGSTMPSPARATVQSDTNEVRVTEWRLAPDTATGHHRHAYDYVVVPMTDGELTAVSSAGRTKNPLKAGQSYFRKAGVEHDVVNETGYLIVFIEIELKR